LGRRRAKDFDVSRRLHKIDRGIVKKKEEKKKELRAVEEEKGNKRAAEKDRLHS